MERQSSHPEVLQEIACAAAAYSSRNPSSLTLFNQSQRYMPGGNTRSALYFAPFPLYIADSFRCHLRDVDGHDYLDVLGEYTAALYGHSEPVIREAITQTAARGFSNGAPGEGEIRLARLMCERFPSVDYIRFCNSGTEANLYALTLARLATGRSALLGFSGAYHGGVFAFPGGGSPMNAPFDWTICRYNDVADTVAAIDRLGASLAAVIVEPMMSNGGCIPADQVFLEVLRARCDASGALLIFDEIVTSRMGPQGMQGITGVLPDLTTFGKYLGAGFSFGAFGGRADIMDLMNPLRSDALVHAGTFNNNVYSMSVGAEALERVFTPARAEKLFADGETLREQLNLIAAAVSPAVQFTGCGSTMNIHFHSGPISCPKDLADEPWELLRLFHLDLLEQGIYAAARGQISLSLPMTDADCAFIVGTVDKVLRGRSDLINSVMTP